MVVGEQRYWTRESEKARPRPGPWPMGVGVAACSCIARAGFTPVDSCRSCLPCKRPRPVSSSPSQPIFSPLQFPTPGQAASPSATKPASPSILCRCRIASCRNLPAFPSPGRPTHPHPHPKSCARSPLTARLLDGETQQKCPHLFRLPLETAPLTDHRDTSIFPPVRHRALRVRTKLSVPSHPRPAPGQRHTQRNLLFQGFVVSFETPARLDGKLTQETMISS